MKVRFQDFVMQSQYEDLIKSGLHWKSADYKIRKIFNEYDGVEE